MPVMKILSYTLFFLLIAFHINAQEKVITGNVYAFKDLALKNIEITAKKAKTTTRTNPIGNFRIACEANDKLEFSGFGFKKTTRKLNKNNQNLNVKLIFKGGDKNIRLATENEHVAKDDLKKSIELYYDQNVEYFNYPDIFTAIDRIYIGNDNIKVKGRSVFVRTENEPFSAVPAIFIVNEKLALEIHDIMPSDIERIEIIPDGSAQYGPGAANGVVLIKTVKN
jgi:hypothetical protein